MQAQHTVTRVTLFIITPLVLFATTLGNGMLAAMGSSNLSPPWIVTTVARGALGLIVGSITFCWRAKLYHMHRFVCAMTHVLMGVVHPALYIFVATEMNFNTAEGHQWQHTSPLLL